MSMNLFNRSRRLDWLDHISHTNTFNYFHLSQAQKIIFSPLAIYCMYKKLDLITRFYKIEVTFIVVSLMLCASLAVYGLSHFVSLA